MRRVCIRSWTRQRMNSITMHSTRCDCYLCSQPSRTCSGTICEASSCRGPCHVSTVWVHTHCDALPSSLITSIRLLSIIPRLIRMKSATSWIIITRNRSSSAKDSAYSCTFFSVCGLSVVCLGWWNLREWTKRHGQKWGCGKCRSGHIGTMWQGWTMREK